jgi:hypothetical protein
VGATYAVLQPDQPAGQQATGAPLMTTDDEQVGTVAHSRVDGEPVLVISVGTGPIGRRLDCRLVRADGQSEVVADWTLEEPGGATWVVPNPDEDAVRLELVDEDGEVWSSARL